MKKYIIYLIDRGEDKAYELAILDKMGQAVFLSEEWGRLYKKFAFKKFTRGYCDFLINRVACNPSDWSFYGYRNIREEEKIKIIQDLLLATDTIEEVKSKLYNLEGHKIIYCYYA